MNTDTGQIHHLTAEDFARELKAGQRLIEIDEGKMTEKQRANMAVSLHDTRSALGKQLHAARSCYMPHVGHKQLAKLVNRAG